MTNIGTGEINKASMNIIEKHFYQSATLPEAPERATLAEAEADEERGVELAAFVALLPTLTVEQWVASRDVQRDASRTTIARASRDVAWDASRGASRGAAYYAAWGASRGGSWNAAWGGAWAGQAIVVRDRISVEHFNILTAPMRAAGIDFNLLTGTP